MADGVVVAWYGARSWTCITRPELIAKTKIAKTGSGSARDPGRRLTLIAKTARNPCQAKPPDRPDTERDFMKSARR